MIIKKTFTSIIHNIQFFGILFTEEKCVVEYFTRREPDDNAFGNKFIENFIVLFYTDKMKSENLGFIKFTPIKYLEIKIRKKRETD